MANNVINFKKYNGLMEKLRKSKAENILFSVYSYTDLPGTHTVAGAKQYFIIENVKDLYDAILISKCDFDNLDETIEYLVWHFNVEDIGLRLYNTITFMV